MPACYPYRLREEGEADAAFGRRIADALEDEILRLGPDTVAAFVVEPVSGATLGTVPPVPGYFRRLREICDRHGVLLVADEVMCGIGRTGTMYALEQEGVAPDVITVAKGLGAGFQPIAAIEAGSRRLWNGHTYMSHVVGCAGALAVLDVIEADGLLARVRRMGDRLGTLLPERLGAHPHVGDIRGRGLFWTAELVRDLRTKTPFPPAAALAARIKAQAQERGLLCYPAPGCADGVAGDHVLLAPPYIVTEEEVAEIVGLLEATLADCLPAALAA